MAQLVAASNRYLQKAKQLAELEIKFIDSRSFRRLKRQTLEKEKPEQIFDAGSETPSQSGTGMMESPLLSTEGETWLFKKMNFLKREVQKACQQLDLESVSEQDVTEIESLIRDIDEARSKIVEANTRLVASIAHKFSNSPQEYDELVSEGNMILVNAVDKFDYSRGFRFSTYATHAVQRHFFRFLQRKQKRKNREVSTSTEILSDVVPYSEEDAPLDYKVAHALIERFGDCLDEREAVIIRERFGLNEDESSATLKVVADRVGLSKERVRQLQMRAIEKLQDLAIKMKLRLEPSF